MNLIKQWLNLFKPVTVEDDAESTIMQASQDIAEAEAAMKKAAYIKHMAEWKLRAVGAWADSQDPDFLAFYAPFQESKKEKINGQ